MLTIDENTRAIAGQNELDVEVGQEVQLAGEFETGCEPIKFENGLETYDVLISPPYRYLGRGREKFVVSASVTGAEELTGAQGSTQLAMGLAWDNRGGMKNPKLTGLATYNYLSGTTLPTYPWYLQSLDRERCLLPDLSQEGTVVSSNTHSLSPEDQELLEKGWESIVSQIRIMVDAALGLDPPLKFYNDNLYFILRPAHQPHVMLGDFDGSAIERHTFNGIDRQGYLSILRKDIHDQFEILMDTLDRNLSFRPELFNL